MKSVEKQQENEMRGLVYLHFSDMAATLKADFPVLQTLLTAHSKARGQNGLKGMVLTE